MKKIVGLFVAILLTASIFMFTACQRNMYLVKEGTLTVVTNAEFNPFEYKEGNEFKGIDMELAKLIADELGLQLEIKDVDFDAVLTNISTNKADIALAALTVSEERKKTVNFTDSYFNASQYIIVKSTDTRFDGLATAAQIEAKIKSINDLTIGVQSGTTGQFYAEGDEDWGFEGLNAIVQTYSRGALAVQKILDGGIDIVIIDEMPAKELVNSIAGVKLINVALTDEEYAIAVRKNSLDLLKDVNAALKKIIADGRFKAIVDKYFEED